MQLREEALFTLKFDGKPTANELGELEKKLFDLKEAQKSVERGTKEWAENKEEIKKLEAAIKQVREEMGVSGMTVRQLQDYYRQLNREIRDLTPGTDAYQKKAAEMTEVNAALSAHRQNIKGVGDEIQKQPTFWEKAKATAVGYLASFGATEMLERAFSFVQDGIQKALALSDMMGGVAKATGLSAEEVQGLSDELNKIDTRTTKESLMDIAQVGGQLGVANTELLGFVKSVDMANVALGDEFSGGAEEVSSKLGGLQKLFKETRDLEAGEAINQIGSAINELGAAGSATGPVIADFTSRMGQLGDLSPQISQTMGLGAAFQELGLSAEISAGGLSNILLTAAKDTATFAQQLGITEGEMKNLINTNPNEFLLRLAQSLKGVPADQLATRLYDLGIKSQEATKVMSLLKDQTDMVREKQELAAVSMTGVYGVALEKAGQSTELFANKLGISQDELNKMIASNPNEFFIKLGNSFKGLSDTQIAEEMKKLGFESKEATQLVSDLAKATNRQQQEQILANPALKEATSLQKEFNTMNSTAAAEYEKSQNALALIATEIGQGLLPALTLGTRGIVTFVNIIREIPAFVSENKTSFAALGVAILALNTNLIAATASSIANSAAEKARLVWTNSATAAQWLLNAAMTANPIGALVAALALLVAGLTAIYNNSETVRGVVNGLWEAFKKGISIMGDLTSQVIDWITKALEPMRPAVDFVVKILEKLWSGIEFGADLFISFHNTIVSFASQALGRVQTALEPVRSALISFGNVLDSMITKVKNVGSAIGSFLHLDDLVSMTKKAASQIGDAFNKGYGDKLKAEQPKQLASHQQHLDDKKANEAKNASELVEIVTQSDQKAIDRKEAQNEKHRQAELKRAAEKAKKEQEEIVKANAEALKTVEMARINAITDELERETAKLEFKYQQELANIEKSKAVQSVKAVWEKALADQLILDKKKLEDEHEKKEAERAKRVLDLKIKLAGDEKADKLQKLEDVAAAQRAQVEKDVQDETEKAQLIAQINTNLIREKEAVELEYRKKKLAQDQALQDAQFQATVADADARLALAKNNAQAIYDAKKDRLDAEYQYNRQKLEREAAEEKAKNQTLIQDADQRALAEKAIDDRLKSQLTSADQQYEAAKTQLTAEKNEARRQNHQQFYDAVRGLMDGDFSQFSNFLMQKLAGEKKQLTEAQQANIDKIDKVGSYFKLATEAMTKISQAAAEKEITKIKKEADTQIKAWQDKYDKGLISKEEFEKETDRINKEADGKVKEQQLAAFKRQKAIDIAQAIIHGAMAALKSLATMGWPLGLVGVAGAAVATALQINNIRKQEPPSMAKGGILNAGVPDGPRHGSTYGTGGLKISRRDTDEEVAEMEGGEPIMVLSRNTYRNNRRVVDSLMHSSLHRNGAPIMRDGGIFGSDGGSYSNYVGKRFDQGGWMTDDGGSSSEYGGGGSYDYSGSNYGGGSADISDSEAIASVTNEQIEKSQMQMEDIRLNTADTVLALADMQEFLGTTFLNTLRSNNENMQLMVEKNLTTLLTQNKLQADALQAFLQSELTKMAGANQATSDAIILALRNLNGSLSHELQNHTGQLGIIAGKNLSVSVQTFVDVQNHINVVNDKSNMQ